MPVRELAPSRKRRNRWQWWTAAVLFSLFALGGRCAQAQSQGPITPPPQKAPQAKQSVQASAAPKISVEAKLVYLYVMVRDKKGKLVPDLTPQDFVLKEDGQPQTITHFMSQADLPLTLGLLVDTSLSQRNVLDDERDTSYKFLDTMLRAGKDQAFVIHFDHEVELLQDLTDSRPKLNAALQELQTPQPQFSNANNGNNGGDGNDGTNTTDPDENVPTATGNGNSGSARDRRHGDSGGGTLLYDAIFLASKDEMGKQQGRKAIFVLSDGVDRGSKETLRSAIEAAQRSDTAVYSIYFADHDSDNGFGHHGWGGGHAGGGWPGGGGGWPGGGGGHRYPQESRADGKKILEQISTATGGQLFQVSKKLSLDQVFTQVEEQLRNQYSLGYQPNHGNSGPGYHKITLTAQKKDLTVQVRDGYYSSN